SRSSGSIPTTTTPTSRTCSSSSWIGSTRQSEPDRCRSRSVRAPPTSPSQTVIKPPRICPEITRPGLRHVGLRGRAEGERLVSQAMALFKQDQAALVDFAGRDAPRLREGIVGRHSKQKRIVEQTN